MSHASPEAPPAVPPLVLTFAASDPTGGAGVQADLLALAALGCHPLSVLTGITVQDTRGVQALQALDAQLVRAQASCLLADVRVAAFKLGVLASAENAVVVGEILAENRGVALVADPVLASGRGDALSTPETVAVLLQKILPLATMATPNTLEAER